MNEMVHIFNYTIIFLNYLGYLFFIYHSWLSFELEIGVYGPLYVGAYLFLPANTALAARGKL